MSILILEPGYFASQKSYSACLLADRIILADHVRYRKKSIFNRTKIRNASSCQWLSIPLLPNMRKNPVYKVKTEDSSNWAITHKRGLDYNYRTSPYYEHFEDHMAEFFNLGLEDLGDWAYHSMLLSFKLLGISKAISRASQLENIPLNMEALVKAQGRAKVLVHESDWWGKLVEEKHKSTYTWIEEPYQQNFDGFVPGMSILDLIFNHGPQSIVYLNKTKA